MVIPDPSSAAHRIPASGAPRPNRRRRLAGALVMECLFALGFIAIAMIPLSFGFISEARYSRACYHRAALGSLIDGELEVLAAGEWQGLRPGTQIYPLKTDAIAGLPPGKTWATRDESARRLRLAWTPDDGRTNAMVSRERPLP